MQKIKSPIKAIRQFCLECMGGSAHEVKNCPGATCQLRAFIFGKNPYMKRVMNPEQRSAAAAVFKKRMGISN